jgi:hypothetical protein
VPDTRPYLSLVATARNDDHGGNLLGRMQAFLDGWIAQARRFSIPSELILVEWNPPPDRPRLAQALRWPDAPSPCQVRILEIPPELHRRYAHAAKLPLYQMIAKNAGIRRARGEFILATNVDILFSSELASFFAERNLERGLMYRIDRHDAMSDVPVDRPIEEQLAWCRSHLLRVNRREGTFHVGADGRPVLTDGDVAAPGSGVLFGEGWLPVELWRPGKPFRWAGHRAELLLDRAPGGAATLAIELEPGPGTGESALDLEVVGDGFESLARVTVDRRSRLRLPLAGAWPKRLWFRVHGGGQANPRDPRVLNFRALRVEWEPEARASRASVEPIGGGGGIMAAWNAMQHCIHRLAHGGPLVTLTVPAPRRLRRWLRAYLDWNGVIGMIRQLNVRLRRRRELRMRTRPGDDIFPPRSGLAPGCGWRALDDYRGEAFRRASNGAEVIVSAAAAGSDRLGIQLESDAPVECALIDAGSGETLARHRGQGPAFVSAKVPRTPGRTQVLRLELGGDSPSVKVHWCGWIGIAGESRPSPLARPWGAGWRWDPGLHAMLATGPAELIVEAPPQRGMPLDIEAEAAEPRRAELRDAGGRRLAAFTVSERAIHRLEADLEPGRTHVLEIAASGAIFARRCEFTNPPVRATVFPHTNGCGDFTLMAREHWFDLRGYPEFDLFSMNIDAAFCVAAHYGGVRERMLTDPMRIYHIEHGMGWTPEGQRRLFERLASIGLPFLDNDEVLGWAAQMRRLNSPMIFNHDDWGLASHELPETVAVTPGVGAAR